MLKSLRKELALLCVVITGVILSATAFGLLFLSERQMDRQSDVTFQNNLNSIIYKIQSSNTLDNSWLSQLETGNRLIVHIEDNGKPVLYHGSWSPETDRDKLVAAAQERARDMGFDMSAKPYSVIDVSTVTFNVDGSSGDHYQAAAAIIPSGKGNWQSLILLRDLSTDANQKLVTRLSFLGMIAAALVLLFLFSWWFSGRSIEPIERSQRKQTEFVAAASHELRSPLAVIQASLPALRDGYAEPEAVVDAACVKPLADGGPADSEVAADKGPVGEPKPGDRSPGTGAVDRRSRFADSIDRECRRMARLIDDLLFLASADAETWTMRRERIEPDTLMMELYESFEPIARKKSISLSLDLPENALTPVFGDRQRMFQALSVLVDNALSYTPAQGRIALRARHQKHDLQLTVSDNGPGVPDSEKDRIFDRFYRADPSRSKKEHYGLGLSVAREIAELHGGTIKVSDTPGGGASFTITIRAAERAA